MQYTELVDKLGVRLYPITLEIGLVVGAALRRMENLQLCFNKPVWIAVGCCNWCCFKAGKNLKRRNDRQIKKIKSQLLGVVLIFCVLILMPMTKMKN